MPCPSCKCWDSIAKWDLHPSLIDEIVAHNAKVIGVEMETYGVFLAARLCSGPRPHALSVKSICDFGDLTKNDEYQRYAGYTSARFLHEFALAQL
jgi:nucleoside phosphorylase